MNKKVELVFVPSIGLSHIIPTVELAKRLIQRDGRFSATFLIMTSSYAPNPDAYIESITNSFPRIHFTTLPQANPPPPGTQPGLTYLAICIKNHQPSIKQAINQLISNSNSPVRLIVDMFTTSMIEVAKELGVPSFVNFTGGASGLGFLLDLPRLDSEITTEFIEYGSELMLPSYVNPVPTLALPDSELNKKHSNYTSSLSSARNFHASKGIIVNSATELESHAVKYLGDKNPRIYPVGPLLDPEGEAHLGSNRTEYDRIMKWLDNQLESSVVYLCFGSRGYFSAPQVEEIAKGLEQSGQRFLWSLRRPPAVKSEEGLPNGFLERVGDRGIICSWAPQVEILAHKAIGGFVSHCGWNSILESVWFGVPLVTWPLDADQKLNAFQLVKDLGLALEIREGFYKEENKDAVVAAKDVERGVRCVLERDTDMRRRVKEMSKTCKMVVTEGGSSWSNLGCLVEDMISVEL